MKSDKINNLFNGHSWLKWVLPVLGIAVIQIIQLFPLWIEQNYSNKFYPNISILLRNITGWFHFSIGDIIYILFGCWLLIKFIKFILSIFKRQFSWKYFGRSIAGSIRGLMWI
ncbi:MAG: DUF3810 family protein, partial [Bacteroidota bacterium]|nr:DUF3810 family protein [Bacteroidota bacterium]